MATDTNSWATIWCMYEQVLYKIDANFDKLTLTGLREVNIIPLWIKVDIVLLASTETTNHLRWSILLFLSTEKETEFPTGPSLEISLFLWMLICSGGTTVTLCVQATDEPKGSQSRCSPWRMHFVLPSSLFFSLKRPFLATRAGQTSSPLAPAAFSLKVKSLAIQPLVMPVAVLVMLPGMCPLPQ